MFIENGFFFFEHKINNYNVMTLNKKQLTLRNEKKFFLQFKN